MCRLVESIKIYNGRLYNIAGHENRANTSRKALFNSVRPLHLQKSIHLPPEYSKGLVKCRIVYAEDIIEISYQPYTLRNIGSLRLISNDTVSYPYKFENRKELDALYHKKGEQDEILIIKNGLLTDSYYYNVVCQQGNTYHTPSRPLLCGVMRSYLLKKNKITERDIKLPELHHYDCIHLINALTPLGKIIVPSNQIFE